MTRLFRRLVTESGLPPVTLHGLRHGAATLAAGTDLKVVQDQLGHSTITLTADTYTSVLQRRPGRRREHRSAAVPRSRGSRTSGRRQGTCPAARRMVPVWARQRRRPAACRHAGTYLRY